MIVVHVIKKFFLLKIPNDDFYDKNLMLKKVYWNGVNKLKRLI